MASDWLLMEWGDIATLEYGKGIRGYEADQGQYRVFGTNGPIGWHDQYIYDKPSVIIGRKGAYRGIHYSSNPFFVIDTAFYLKPKVEMDLRWAYYQLLTQDINGMDSGSAIPSTSRESFYRLPVLVPPLPAQHAIAHILGTLDDKIELNRRMNATLEAIARALFQSWFVNFDPVRAKSEGRQPEGMDAETAALFPDALEDSELGLIPAGWDLTPLDHVLQESNERVGWADVPEYSSTNNGLQPRSERYKKQLSVSIDKNKIIRKGSLVFGMSRELLNFGLMRDEIGSVSSAYKVYKIDENSIEPDILEQWIRQRSAYFLNAAAASSREGQSISSAGLLMLKFVRPTAAVRAAFYRAIEPLRQGIAAIQQETNTLTEIRDALLPKLISGQVRVADAEKVGEAAK